MEFGHRPVSDTARFDSITPKQPWIHVTQNGTPYLRKPGIVPLTMPMLITNGPTTFLHHIDLSFESAELDDWNKMSAGELAIKFAGQLCYLAFGDARTKNADMLAYLNNILKSGHGSVLEHANYGFWVYGISRACSHEIVRHRHLSPSQLSQRYVDPDKVRFVLHPGFAHVKRMVEMFENRIDKIREEYIEFHKYIEAIFGEDVDDSKRDRRRAKRKMINQAARMMLPNETETMMVLTGNLRAWRHFFRLRGSSEADAEIRQLAVEIYRALVPLAPNALQDIYEALDPYDNDILVVENAT